MKPVDLIICAKDSGRSEWRCGLGPRRILEQFLASATTIDRDDLRIVEIETQVDYETDSSLVFEAQRQIAQCAARSRTAGRFPLVLGGNCNTALGGMSGTGAADCGLIWFDAHGDFNTPENTETGFLDGMGLAMAVGRCWRHVLSTVPGFSPIEEELTALVGARDLDPWEAEDLADSAIARLSVADIRQAGIEAVFGPFISRLTNKAGRVYLHIDIDVLDPAAAPANHYNAAGGLSIDELAGAIAFIGGRIPIAGGGIGSYDPAFDAEGRTAQSAVRVIEALTGRLPEPGLQGGSR
ncbi:MAG: arginase family protein [Parvibaculaceae bacterium]